MHFFLLYYDLEHMSLINSVGVGTRFGLGASVRVLAGASARFWLEALARFRRVASARFRRVALAFLNDNDIQWYILIWDIEIDSFSQSA